MFFAFTHVCNLCFHYFHQVPAFITSVLFQGLAVIQLRFPLHDSSELFIDFDAKRERETDRERERETDRQTDDDTDREGKDNK